MKILEKILYGILILLTLLSIFIILCAANPKLKNSVMEFMYSLSGDQNEVMMSSDGLVSPPNTLSGSNTADSDGQGILANEKPATDYRQPERADVKAPDGVAGRSGYEPIGDNTEEVDEDEAEELQNQTDYGETGEELTFDTEFYPYYGMLDSNLQKLYRQIYANIAAAKSVFTPVEAVNTDQLKTVLSAVYFDHPELFWIGSSYGGKCIRGGIYVEIALQFNKTADNLEASKAAFNSVANEILAGARNLGSSYEKEVYVHNALLDRITYNLGAPLNQTAYSALVNGQTVCAGYARAFQYLMQQLQIPCYYCVGFAGENHAWNIIKLEGDCYNVDTTWDDTNPNTYDYFNKTDADIARDHRREDLSVYLPACNGTRYGNMESNPKPEERNREQNQNNNNDDDGLRSLEEVGFSEQDVLTNIEDYYDDCYNQIMKKGKSMQFQNVAADMEVLGAIQVAYNSGIVNDECFYPAAEELGMKRYECEFIAEELKGGRFLIKHTLSLYE